MQAQSTTSQVTPPASNTPLIVLRRRQVEERTGLSRSTLYHYNQLGHFPNPMAQGRRLRGWLESAVHSWNQVRFAGHLDARSRWKSKSKMECGRKV